VQRLLELRRHDLAETRKQLEAANKAKLQIEQELAQARAEQKAQQIEAEKQQAAAQKRLREINQSLRAALTKQIQTQAQLNRTRGQLERVSSQYQQAQARLNTVTQQAQKLRQEIQQNQKELQKLIAQRNELKARIAQRDREIAKLDQVIQQRDLSIAQREIRLQELEKQQEMLEQEAIILGRNLQVLRQGNVALFRGQVLAAQVVRIVRPSAARQAVEEILREANRNAIHLTQPGVEEVTQRVVKISEPQVEQLIKQIDDGQDYFVRIISANNYVVGEKFVQVFVDTALNQQRFTAGEVLARISADPTTMTTKEIRRRVDLLIGAAKFSAQRGGVLNDNLLIADNRIQTLIRFFEQLQRYKRPVELKAIAAQDIYTAGPLAVELLALENGQVVFSTQTVPQPAKQGAGSGE
jgi:uncharacterized protein (DUF3084 family)